MVIALAAVLWLVYLVPTWFRRREYLSTERNAVRLQQTLRILAETAEVPEPIHVESTARSVAVHQKLLRLESERTRAVERAREAAMSRAATHTLASLKPALASAVLAHSPAAVRLRRSRAATSAVLLVAVIAAVTGFTPVAGAGASALIIVGGIAAALSLGLLSRMAAVAKQRALVLDELASRPTVRRPVTIMDVGTGETVEAAAPWTPVPLPKPLYLSRPAPQSVVSEAAIIAAKERLLAEAHEAERAGRAAAAVIQEAETGATGTGATVTPITRPAATSRFAQMGFIDQTPTAAPNLDEVLRRRRAV